MFQNCSWQVHPSNTDSIQQLFTHFFFLNHIFVLVFGNTEEGKSLINYAFKQKSSIQLAKFEGVVTSLQNFAPRRLSLFFRTLFGSLCKVEPPLSLPESSDLDHLRETVMKTEYNNIRVTLRGILSHILNLSV